MKFTYKREANIEIGQKLYGIIATSIYTHDGVHPVTVYKIDYNNEEVIFVVKQPCRYVSCNFRDMEDYVFESEKEASDKKANLKFGVGMYAYEDCYW
jgi:hypothetical protein